MKTPQTGPRPLIDIGSRKPLHPLPCNKMYDKKEMTVRSGSGSNSSPSAVPDNTVNVNRMAENNDPLELIEKHICNIKISDGTKEKGTTDCSIEDISEGLKQCSLKEESAQRVESCEKNVSVADIAKDKQNEKSKTLNVEDKKKEKVDELAHRSTEKKDNETDKAQEKSEDESTLRSRSPTRNRSTHHLTPSAWPYLRDGNYSSRIHQSGGVICVGESPGQTPSPLCNGVSPYYGMQAANITQEETEVAREVSDEIEKAIDGLLREPEKVAAINNALGVLYTEYDTPYPPSHCGTRLHDRDDDGYPPSPELGTIVQPNSISPRPAYEGWTQNFPDYPEPRSVGSEGSDSSGISSLSGTPPPQFDMPTHPDCAYEYGGNSHPQSPFPKITTSNPQKGTVQSNPLFSQNIQSSPPQTFNCPAPPQPSQKKSLVPKVTLNLKPIQKKFLTKLDKDRKPQAWATVQKHREDALVSADTDGDTPLMILLGNPREGFLEMVYAVVERIRKISGALPAQNKRGQSALYIASMQLPQEPLVAAYIAEALLEQKADLTKYTYEGLPLIDHLKKKGQSHQEVLRELLSLRHESGQPVFHTHVGCDINGNL